ncbi:hypothetical protein JOF42_002915 [Microbacterium phyllosphaerae]|uniref:Nuclear transport factor 2 family protein n=1 Tax=Microbacterium phyllosphaerae TaxID=124798 RepID=A0ABS4WTA7_9MICO|nr:hypothetical protein [Microbacterium phyllosphaerae]MBP2379420.1 hypothetical protein [Microbacterium phyllosphaerae]
MLSVRGRKNLAVGAYVVSTLMVLGTAQLVGCAPEPAPAPSPTPAFASEEEAFAAAEEVYRAYNDAGNARIRGEQEPDPQSFLEGVALEGDIEGQGLLREWGFHASGEATIMSFVGREASVDDPIAEVTGYVCIDVSKLRVISRTGLDVTPPDRGDVVSQVVQFAGDSEHLMITRESSADEGSC